MLKAILPAADYLYLCRFASDGATRPHIAGVFVDVANKRLVATDGHRLGLLDMSEDMAAPGPEPITLANSKDLQRACKAGRNEKIWLRCYSDRVEIVSTSAEKATAANLDEYPSTRLTATLPAASVYVGVEYPDYQRIIPETCSGTLSGYAFNAAYLASFASADKNQQAVKLVPSDGSPAMVFNTDPRFLGVCMPMRNGFTPRQAAEQCARIMGRPAPVESMAA